MLHPSCFSHTLDFTFPAGTSRGVMNTRTTYFIVLTHEGKQGIGECAPLPGLSQDYTADMLPVIRPVLKRLTDEALPRSVAEVNDLLKRVVPTNQPSVRFGLETALLDLLHGGQRHIVPSAMQPTFDPVPINGLVWMGDRDLMRRQIDEKLAAGFRCVKMKIGAIDFEEELRLLGYIREHASAEEITLRVDANGAFTPDGALDKLHRLAAYDIHSIEQPIMAGQPKAMAALCRETPVPIALDEELIGAKDAAGLLDTIQPQYIILKPSLVGGLTASNRWIEQAEARGIDWWATSALESNVGLNAIAQWVAAKRPTLPQGLGTGQLYHNNIDAPIVIEQGYLRYDNDLAWDLSLFA